jgi:hypothetical protein
MLLGVWKKSGEKPRQLVEHPDEPEAFPWIWRWLNEIPSPITWSEINAWSQISRIQVERWEGILLIRFDRMMRTQ